MSEVKSVLYTGAFRFPDQDAAAFRVLSVAELFKSSGSNVVFAGWENDYQGMKQYVYKEYNCFSQNEFRSGEINPIRRLLGFLFRGHKTAKWIWNNRENFDVVVAYNPTVFFSLILLLIRKLAPFKVVLDSTEWYESAHLPGGRFGLAAFENWVRMNFVYKLFSNAICISSYLEKHLLVKNSIRIPPLLPEDNAITLDRPDINAGVNLIYAGEIGKKDRLVALIASLPEIQEKIRIRIQIHVVGMSWNDLSVLIRRNNLNPNYLSSFVLCYGRLTRHEVLRLYSICHFSVLFRDFKRYALAGFPTKAMESLASGCPIITNATGDLSNFLENGANAFIVQESELSQKLPTLLSHALSGACYLTMVESARLTAIQNFSPDVYKNNFSKFIDALLD